MTITSPVDQNTQIDPRDPVVRLENLFDPASLEFITEPDASGALAARGLIDGEPTIAYATDATVMGGAMGLDYDEALGVLWVEADDGYNGTLAQLTLNGATWVLVPLEQPAQ